MVAFPCLGENLLTGEGRGEPDLNVSRFSGTLRDPPARGWGWGWGIGTRGVL